MAKYKIDGMQNLLRSIDKLGKAPQKCVTKAAKFGAKIALTAIRSNAPEDTGDLKKGIVLKGERSRFKSKKVYQVTFNPAMNDIFAKNHKMGAFNSKLKNSKSNLGSTTRAYYPASQEYGYFLRDGRYMPGLHFMRDTAIANEPAVKTAMVSVLSKEVDKALKG